MSPDPIHRFESPEAAAGEAARLIADALAGAISARGAASLAVSGGRTPVLTFAHLSAMKLDWARVAVTLVDERWVDPSSPDSNERLVRDHLLVGPATEAHFVPMKTPAATPTDGRAACNAALTALPAPLDAVLLGMGEDGHFASLFPRSPALAEGLSLESPELCLAIPQGTNGDAPPQARISLSLAAIARAHRVVLQTSGDVKLAMLERIRSTGGDAGETPVAALFAARPDTVVLHSA